LRSRRVRTILHQLLPGLEAGTSGGLFCRLIGIVVEVGFRAPLMCTGRHRSVSGVA